MKKILYTIKKHNFYYRMLVPYLTLSIIIVCLTAGMSWNIIGSKYNEQIKETNRHMLAQVQIHADQNLYRNCMTIINDNFLMGYSNSSLTNFFSHESQLTHFNYYLFFQAIKDICFKNPFIEYITLYRRESNYLIDNEYGLNMHPDTTKDLLDRSLPFTSYRSLATGEEKLRFIASQKDQNALRPSLTLLRSIPLYSTFDTGNGFIALTIDQNKFMDSLKSVYQFNGGLMILDESNQVLLEKIPSDISNSERITLVDHLSSGPTNDIYNYNGTAYNITVIHSSTSHWNYVSFIPVHTLNAEIIATRHIVFMLAILIVLLCIIFVGYIASRVYHPLKVLRNQISNQSNSESKDDIAAINDALFFLEDQIDDMKHTITQNKNIIMYKILMDILYNRHINETDILRRLALCDVTFNLPHYCILIVDIEATTFYSLTMDQREYITTKSQEFANDWFTKNVIQMTESQPPNRIVTALNLRHEQYERLLLSKEEFLTYMESNLHVRVNIAISPMVSELDELSSIFTRTGKYLRYSFIYGYSNIYTPDMINGLDASTFELSLADYRHYKNLIRSGNIEEAMELLREYRHQISNGTYSYESINSFLIQLYHITFKVAHELTIFQDADKKESILQDFKSTTDVSESFECLGSILLLFHEAYHKRHNQNDTRLINEIVVYIKENSCEELSLSSISDRFNVSTSHLSRLFKTITGDNLSVYVINCKLETAAYMLINQPEINISDIAKSLGYYTPAYFTKLFKNKYGMTPTHYRKNARIDIS